MTKDLIEFESTSRFGRLRQKAKEKKIALQMRASTKKAQRKKNKARIEKIKMQERRSLERRFIRKKVKEQLAKEYKVKSKPKADVRSTLLGGDKKKKPGVTLF